MTTLDRDGITARIEPTIEGLRPFGHIPTVMTAINLLHNVAALADALSSLPAQAVEVKPLEWRKWDQRDNGGSADTIVGHYHVWTHHEANGRWFWRLSTTGLGPIAVQGECATEDEAKAAAQADYEARILSALAPSQPAAVGERLNDEEKRILGNIKWESVDRDNMEFTARVSCYQLDALNKLLSALRSTP